MIIRSLFKGFRGHDWFIVLVEVMLLAIGLLAAFQVDRWREQRAERLAENQALIDWLPQIREMQIYFIICLDRQIERAKAVLEVLRAYADEIGANSR
jgi:hypothetical protein